MSKKLVLLAALWLLAWPAWAAGLSVTVNAEATVTGSVITLGELAMIAGDDQDRVKALSAAKLGEAPSPGHRVVMASGMLGTRLASTGLDLTGITWQVPPTITVATAAQTVSGERLLAVATEAVKRQLGPTVDSEDTVTISPLGMPPDTLAPLGKLDIKAEAPAGIRFNAPTAVVVTISADDRPFTNISLRFNIRSYQQVVVAARNVAAKEELTSDNLRYERREVGKIVGYITDMEKTLGLTARRPMMAGTPLTEAAVDKPVIVRRGAAVTIFAKSGGMTVTAGGQAMQDGREGEVIRVQNLKSKRILSARVLDANTVQVIIYGGR